MADTHRISFEPVDIEMEVSEDETILDAAFRQLLNYAVALGNPPLLIASDMDRIVIRTHWTNTVQRETTLTLDDLRDAGRTFECFCTRREILDAPSAPHAPQGAYPGTCRDLTAAERDDDERAEDDRLVDREGF